MNFSILKIIFLYALRDVSRSRVIFFMTIVSLSVIFTAIFLTSGILDGFGNSLSNTQIDSMGEIVIVPEGDDYGMKNISLISSEIKKNTNVKSITRRNIGTCLLEYKDKVLGPYFNLGVDVENEIKTSVLHEKLIAGRFLEKDDTKSVMLGATIADALVDLEYDKKSASVGDYITLTSMSGNKWKYKIVGIIDSSTFDTNWTTFMTLSEMKSFHNLNNVGQISVKLFDDKKIEETKKEIENKNLPITVQSWREHAGFINDIILAFGSITGIIITLLSLAVFMVTSVILYINFLQYKRQIGILKAMGTSTSFIVLVYMIEAFIFATLSFGIAFTVFFFMNIKSNQNPIHLLIGDFHTSLSLDNILLTFILLVFSAVGGSIIPAILAARTNIVDIIRES